MKKNITFSVAIPARNEEKTIVGLIHSIKSQKHDGFKLERISVYSDGSTDKTVSLVKTNFNDIKVYDFKEKRGKTAMLNLILSRNTSDVIILTDADTKFGNKNVFNEILKKFRREKNVGIVCVYHKFLVNDSLIGKLSHFGFRIWDNARKSLGKKGIRYYCEGGLIAFSYDFAKKIRYPEDRHIGDDTYAFYFAAKHGFKVLLSKKSIVNYELPRKYSDYVKQMKRFLSDTQMIKKVFAKPLFLKYETMTRSLLAKSFFVESLKNPYLAILYLILQMTTRLQMPFFKPKVGWTHMERI